MCGGLCIWFGCVTVEGRNNSNLFSMPACIHTNHNHSYKKYDNSQGHQRQTRMMRMMRLRVGSLLAGQEMGNGHLLEMDNLHHKEDRRVAQGPLADRGEIELHKTMSDYPTCNPVLTCSCCCCFCRSFLFQGSRGYRWPWWAPCATAWTAAGVDSVARRRWW